MKIPKISALIAAAALSACASTETAQPSPNLLQNGDFETAQLTDVTAPKDWQVDGLGPIYALDNTIFHRGKSALKVGFKDGANKNGYSGTIQSLDTGSFAGKRVALTVYLRRSTEKSTVGIWVSMNDADKKRLAYLNSYEQPMPKVNSWTQHKLEFDVPREAVGMMLGASIYEGDGEMWVDDISLRALGQ